MNLQSGVYFGSVTVSRHAIIPRTDSKVSIFAGALRDSHVLLGPMALEARSQGP